MATYKDIQAHVRGSAGFLPQTCWIAHVLSDNGLVKRTAPNRIDRDGRVKPCPPAKRKAIEAALRHFQMI